jgi:signal transduction histidine kinase
VAGMEKATPEMRRKAGATIRKQVERITDLVADILDFTQGSRTEAIMGLTDYPAFVQQVVEEIRAEADLRSCKLECEAPPPPARLRIDPKRLRRVFYNLIHNATDAMPKGGTIIVRFHLDDAEMVTEIEDAGPGIAPEIADRLFEVFATYGKEHGTGLGLSICKRIVEDHHGRIWARNQPGRGALFCFALPVPK